MAAGDFGGAVLRATAGVMSEIDPKSTLKFMNKEGKKAMQSSKAFKTGANTTKFLAGGIKDSIKNSKGNKDGIKGVGNAIKKAHSVTKKVNGKNVTSVSAKKVAGTTIGIGLAGRVVTGGGLYKDKNGNTNLPGIPFI